MGLRSFFRGDALLDAKALTATPAVIEAASTGRFSPLPLLGGTNPNSQRIQAAWTITQSADYAYLYAHQPSVRKVIDYIAANIAQLGLKLYERRGDTDRVRDTTHPAALTMDHPNDLGPATELILGLVSDFLVHDNAYALKLRANGVAKRVIIRVPPPAIGVLSQSKFAIDAYRIWLSDGTFKDIPPSDIIHWRGYNPDDPRVGISKLETLRQILAEETASQAASAELYKSGLAKPGYITRPAEAPEWSEEGRKRFQRSWSNQAKISSRETPVLEEGMEFADFGISPQDAQMLESRRFTNEEVASLYGLAHVPPEGEDERKAFYADVLPPLCESFAEQLDFSLLQAEYALDDYYWEFDLNEKLRGDPKERFAAITSAVGRPWLLVDEARALENLPKVDGGDELTIPLNVTIGELPAPNVMPPQDPLGPPADGSHRETAALANGNGSTKALAVPRHAAQLQRRNRYAGGFKGVLERFYARQENTVVSKGVKAPFDQRRWDKELSDDLERELRAVVEREGDVTARRLGLFNFDTRQVKNYLRAQAEGVAKSINDVTRAELTESKPADVFDRAKNVRAPVAGMSLATAAAAFAGKEAAMQAPDTQHRTKTWINTSANSEHPEMDGETVPLGATFSNGTDGPPADHPGCQCLLDIT